MGVNPANLEKLIALAQAPSSGQWESLLDEVASLFLESADDYTAEEKKLYGEVLLALLPRVEVEGRRRLAERLSAAPEGPEAVLRALAKDVDKVAVAVCLRGPGLDDATLIDGLRRSDVLRATIAGRRTLSTAVLEALLKTGDPRALQVLVENHAVDLRPAMLHEISRFARHRPKLQQAMIARADLPPALADEMYEWVDDGARGALLERGDVDEWSVEAVASGRARAPAPAPPVPLGDKPQIVEPETPRRRKVGRNSTRQAAQQSGRLPRKPLSKYDQRIWTGPLLIGVTALLIGLVVIAGAIHG
ncbi:MAG: DUF2336 domain-containing protein [Alphaproteobacteria bacterium]